jgi:hypothetical protein
MLTTDSSLVGACTGMSAGFVAPPRHDSGAVGVEYDRGFVVTVPGAGCDSLVCRLHCERGR